MSDNVRFQREELATAPPATEVAADNIGDVVYQRMKIVLGEDGENMGDLSDRHPLPVKLDLAAEILTQLKIMNAHLQMLTDEHITETDIGE